MATLRGGAKICDGCGYDCTRLYGFAMEVRKNMMQDLQVMKEVDRVDEEFGQHDFVFCWSCTAKAFGAKTLEQKAEAENVDDELKVKQDRMAKARETKELKAKTGPKDGHCWHSGGIAICEKENCSGCDKWIDPNKEIPT